MPASNPKVDAAHQCCERLDPDGAVRSLSGSEWEKSKIRRSSLGERNHHPCVKPAVQRYIRWLGIT